MQDASAAAAKNCLDHNLHIAMCSSPPPPVVTGFTDIAVRICGHPGQRAGRKRFVTKRDRIGCPLEINEAAGSPAALAREAPEINSGRGVGSGRGDAHYMFGPAEVSKGFCPPPRCIDFGSYERSREYSTQHAEALSRAGG